MTSTWDCERHGPVHPLNVLPRPSVESLHRVATPGGVPRGPPLPLPRGWPLPGGATAGDERSPAKGTVMALAGPSPLGGPADMLLIAEEPGVGLGSRFAG